MHTKRFDISFRRAGLISLPTLLLASVTSTATLAQTVPTAVDPGQIEKRFEPTPRALPPSNLQAPATPEPALSKQMREQLAKKRFVLKGVEIEGATIYGPEAFRGAYQEYLGKDISLLEAQQITRNINSMYQRDGYVLSVATLPQQAIRGGMLKIRVVEGYISNVVIQGDIKDGRAREIVQSYASEIKAQKPIRTTDLERYLLLMNDLPGADAKGLVRPSGKPGSAELVVQMAQKPFEGSYTLDNRGTKFVGPWQHTATATANSLFNMYDRTLLRFVTVAPTKELRFYNIQHEEQIGSEGTQLILDYAHSETRPGDALKILQIEGDSDFGQVKVRHPFIRSRQENLVGRAMFDARNTDTDVFGGTDFTTDRLRVARAGGNYDFADDWNGFNLIDGQVSQGVDIFNASKRSDSNSSIGVADATFTKLNLDLTRTQTLPRNFSVFTAASGQYAFDPLLAAEKFTLGGIGFGQAFDPSELTGDHGLAGKVELRYGQALNDYYLQAYQLYGYYDVGKVWVRNVSGPNDKSLSSVGLGLRTNFTENLSSNLEFAMPISRDVNNQGAHGDETRIFFSTTARF